MKNNKSQSGATPKLCRELAKLDNAQRDEIRRLYYQVADALPQLATALEVADLDTGESPGALLDQHFACCEMLDAMKKLDLGKYL
jgi:hypothetical protein